MSKIYDVIIIGGGPAGLSAALYASRSKLSTLILEKTKMGGQIVTTEEVANYPGSLFDEGEMETSGPKLIGRMVQQAEHFGAERIMKGVANVDFAGEVKKVYTEDGTEFQGKTVIIATGAYSRKLGVPGEKELTGKGVSYCATCDADFFTDLEVFCVGAGYAAAEEAMYLTKFARKVTVVAREPEFTCAASIAEHVMNHPQVDVKFNTEITDMRGDGILEGCTFKNNITGETWDYEADEEDGTFGIFVFIGYIPATDVFKGHIAMDQWGYIPTDEFMATNVPGVYAAGDLRPKELRQVITAAADGAVAATAAEKYLGQFEETTPYVATNLGQVVADEDAKSKTLDA
ncbi:thioredoxin reductase [Propionigenium maris DSM 9537]|uniref:Thioredoxin reductase n=1 Tax=Propionigenium maris DSM 9537 TaxID=1123000 RepID=A0A9W6GM79_9FUSO|nr:FAD-dependent oxidoreductase [Propionigenium maris]GLI56857.1 thioredoxin reductase [Propionigenium maris DSM 9537]